MQPHQVFKLLHRGQAEDVANHIGCDKSYIHKCSRPLPTDDNIHATGIRNPVAFIDKFQGWAYENNLPLFYELSSRWARRKELIIGEAHSLTFDHRLIGKALTKETIEALEAYWGGLPAEDAKREIIEMIAAAEQAYLALCSNQALIPARIEAFAL